MQVRNGLLFIGLLAASSCSDAGFETRSHELAHAGGWDPPAHLVALADTFDIENVQAGPWIGEEGCSRTFLEGTQVVQDWIYEYWPQVSYIGGYSCRPIADSSSMSVHATGRALDIMIPTDTAQPKDDSADNDLGDPLANWLLEHAEEIGIQSIIWDNMIWSSSRGPGERFRVYTKEHKHHDHLHIELNPEAAALGTPWFDTEMGAPDLGPCGEPLPAEGGTVDDTDSCFTAYGPSQYWRRVDGEGHGGSLRWTNAFEADEPSNWARWNLNLAEAGEYRVEYFSTAEWAVYDSARYQIKHAGAQDDVHVDLSAGEDGWQSLGEFPFDAGDDQWVSLFDNAPLEVPAEQHIVADAIRLVRLDLPPQDVVQEPSEGEETEPGFEQEPPGSAPENTDSDTVIHGEGGCSTADASPSGSLLPLVGLVFGVMSRRRR